MITGVDEEEVNYQLSNYGVIFISNEKPGQPQLLDSVKIGLRQLWKRHKNLIPTVSIDDEGVWIDLDTRQDYQSCKPGYKFVK